jgi:hypothetical protein
MSHTYENMLAELAEELPAIERKVFDALKRNPQGLKREQLVAIVFGAPVKAGALVNNDTKDRKVRKAIESLRSRLVPIVSSSAQAGYRLDTSRDGRARMLADLISRRDKLSDLISRAAKFYELPEQVPVAEQASQSSLFEQWRGLPG